MNLKYFETKDGVINFHYFYFAVKKKPKEITFPAGGRVCPPEAGIVGRA
jgi:hypothetical protein